MKTNEEKKVINFDLNTFKSTELLNSSKGITRENIYKDDVLGNSEKDIKTNRKKVRNLSENYFTSILAISDKSKAMKLAKDFEDFYKTFYKINDFSISSVCSANMKENKKEIFAKGIEKFKTLLSK